TVTREAIGGVLFHHALEDIQTGTWHACATIPCEMACPYFYPVEARAGSAMLRLGDWGKGVCHAVPGPPAEAGGAGAAAGARGGPGRRARAPWVRRARPGPLFFSLFPATKAASSASTTQ